MEPHIALHAIHAVRRFGEWIKAMHRCYWQHLLPSMLFKKFVNTVKSYDYNKSMVIGPCACIPLSCRFEFLPMFTTTTIVVLIRFHMNFSIPSIRPTTTTIITTIITLMKSEITRLSYTHKK